jgi:hypothetical protein
MQPEESNLPAPAKDYLARMGTSKALSLMERMVIATEATCLTNLAEAHRQHGRYHDAEERFLQALDAMSKVGAHPDRARALHSLGCTYPTAAEVCLTAALHLWQEQKASVSKSAAQSAVTTRNN